MICLKCLGEGCQDCGRQGFISEEPGEIESDEIFRAYKWLKKYNVFPAPGTWMDQTAIFVNTVEFIDLLEGAWYRLRERRNKATEELARKYGKRS